MNSPELVSTILGEIQGVLDTFDYASLDIVAGELNAARHVVVAGEGRSGFMAKAFAMRLMHLGVPVHVVGETTTPALGSADLLVAVSGSGTTASTVRAAQQANAVGGRVIAVTTDPDSPLATAAATVVHVPAATKYRKPGEAATILARSRGLETLAGLRPVLSWKRVFHRPSRRALTFIASTKAASPPG